MNTDHVSIEHEIVTKHVYYKWRRTVLDRGVVVFSILTVYSHLVNVMMTLKYKGRVSHEKTICGGGSKTGKN